ncbi:MAG: methyltransferase [Verrucomicrobia bacterium]|nr:methyltransferase [Verrucomicrobiota bacterium]
MAHETHFKGWAKPGPIPPGLAAGVKVEPHETLDAISGNFRLFQLRDGHRFSTDDILAAWYATSWCPAARTALDLGSGIGTVGMICAWRLPGARFVTVEAQSESVALARKSARFNGLTDRYEIRLGDFRETSERGQPCPREPNATEEPADTAVRAPGQCVLRPDEKFELITGSPPYFPPEGGVKSEHPQRLACRFELRGTIADYCATAATHLASGGFFACVFPTEPAQLERIESGAKAAGLVIVRKRPVIFREGEPPLIALFGMMRADDLPEWFRGQTWEEPPLIIRTRDGGIHPEYSAVKLAIGFPP